MFVSQNTFGIKSKIQFLTIRDTAMSSIFERFAEPSSRSVLQLYGGISHTL